MKLFLQWWPVVALALQALAVWACWSLRQMAKTEIEAVRVKLADDIDAQDTRITKVEGRVDGHEDDIKNLPTKADLERVAGEVKVVNANVEAAAAGIRRIEGFFLEKGVERA